MLWARRALQELRSAQPSPAEEMFKVGYPTLVLKSSGTLYPEGPKDPGTVANESFDKAPPELLEQLVRRTLMWGQSTPKFYGVAQLVR